MLTTAERSARYRAKDVEAYRKKKAAYARTPEERAKRREYMKKWREKNRERHNELARESHHRNKHKHITRARAYSLKRKYGISLSDYDAMEKSQSGACWICKKVPSGKRRNLHVDHDHATGKVRALLCGPCNGSLGWYEIFSERVDLYLKAYSP